MNIILGQIVLSSPVDKMRDYVQERRTTFLLARKAEVVSPGIVIWTCQR